MFPCPFIFPTTSNFSDGAFVPIPTLPSSWTLNNSLVVCPTSFWSLTTLKYSVVPLPFESMCIVILSGAIILVKNPCPNIPWSALLSNLKPWADELPPCIALNTFDVIVPLELIVPLAVMLVSNTASLLNNTFSAASVVTNVI